ncbi:hypothetical protein ACFL56_02140 [Candidatus Margulisiibacteriota bacterium]
MFKKVLLFGLLMIMSCSLQAIWVDITGPTVIDAGGGTVTITVNYRVLNNGSLTLQNGTFEFDNSSNVPPDAGLDNSMKLMADEPDAGQSATIRILNATLQGAGGSRSWDGIYGYGSGAGNINIEIISSNITEADTPLWLIGENVSVTVSYSYLESTDMSSHPSANESTAIVMRNSRGYFNYSSFNSFQSNTFEYVAANNNDQPVFFSFCSFSSTGAQHMRLQLDTVPNNQIAMEHSYFGGGLPTYSYTLFSQRVTPDYSPYLTTDPYAATGANPIIINASTVGSDIFIGNGEVNYDFAYRNFHTAGSAANANGWAYQITGDNLDLTSGVMGRVSGNVIVSVAGGLDINVASGATFDAFVDTISQAITFNATAGTWNGIDYAAGSMGTVHHVHFHDGNPAVRFDSSSGTSPNITSCNFYADNAYYMEHNGNQPANNTEIIAGTYLYHADNGNAFLSADPPGANFLPNPLKLTGNAGIDYEPWEIDLLFNTSSTTSQNASKPTLNYPADGQPVAAYPAQLELYADDIGVYNYPNLVYYVEVVNSPNTGFGAGGVEYGQSMKFTDILYDHPHYGSIGPASQNDAGWTLQAFISGAMAYYGTSPNIADLTNQVSYNWRVAVYDKWGSEQWNTETYLLGFDGWGGLRTNLSGTSSYNMFEVVGAQLAVTLSVWEYDESYNYTAMGTPVFANSGDEYIYRLDFANLSPTGAATANDVVVTNLLPGSFDIIFSDGTFSNDTVVGFVVTGNPSYTTSVTVEVEDGLGGTVIGSQTYANYSVNAGNTQTPLTLANLGINGTTVFASQVRKVTLRISQLNGGASGYIWYKVRVR